MRKYNKLILILIVLMLAMTFMLVACDPVPDPVPEPDPVPKPDPVVSNEELYETARSSHIAMNGYTLNMDSIDATDPDNKIVLFYHEDVTVSGADAIKTTEMKKIPSLGEEEEIIKPEPETLSEYKGTKINANLFTAYLVEGYTIVKEGDILTVTGTVEKVVEVFGANAVKFKDMNIVIKVDVSKNAIMEYTATYKQGTFTSTMKYTMKAAPVVA